MNIIMCLKYSIPSGIYSLSLTFCLPDVTSAVDWALKANYLYISILDLFISVCVHVCVYMYVCLTPMSTTDVNVGTVFVLI